MWILELAFDLTNDDERLARRPQHRERLKAHHAAGVVPYAGPLAGGAGAVVLWDVPDEGTVRELMAQDPYYSSPNMTEVSLRGWETLPL
jgi:uncharacterized protein YciI